MRNVNHHIHIHVEAMTDTHTHFDYHRIVSMLGNRLIQSCEKEMKKKKKKKAENTADVGLELLWLRRLALTANREQRKNNVIYANTQKLMRA